MTASKRLPGPVMRSLLTSLLLGTTVSACAHFTVVDLPAPNCLGYVPASLRAPVPGAPLPAKEGLTIGQLAAHDDAQTGQLEKKNTNSDAAFEIMQTCEDRYAALKQAVTKKPWWKF
jgi:hypothetical protein